MGEKLDKLLHLALSDDKIKAELLKTKNSLLMLLFEGNGKNDR